MADTIIKTGSFVMPNHLATNVWKQVQDQSVIGKLVGTTPFKFGKTDIMTFTDAPRAEYVGEGADKSPASTGWGVKTAATHKVQVTVRMDEEVQYQDEDYQLNALTDVTDAMSIALSRALDLGVFHAINPLTGATAASITDTVCATTNSVETAGDVEADIENSSGLVIAHDFVPTGIALDPNYAWLFKTAKYADGRRKYPDLSINIKSTSSLEGLTAAVSNTVSASKEAATATKVKGIVGQWDALKWGVVREIPIETIKFGDPDGQGDLKRKNQIALRAEVFYGWAVMDPLAFAKIVDAVA